MADQAGAGLLTRLEATFNYSFLISLGRDYDHNIRLGVAGGLRQTSIDFYRLQFPDQFGPNGVQGPTNEPIGRNGSRIREEVSAGALYYNDLFYFGTTVSHITQPDQTFIDEGSAADTELPMRITGFTGMELPLQPQRDPDGPSIQPAVSYQYQDPFQSLNIGTYVNLDPIVVGAWYQALTDNNTMTGLVGVQTGMFKIGYSYDFVVSGLGNAASGGAHEISLVVNFEGGDRKPYEPQAKMSCPKY
jgi:type IX secretion system PorP/SprF family membrane protein